MRQPASAASHVKRNSGHVPKPRKLQPSPRQQCIAATLTEESKFTPVRLEESTADGQMRIDPAAYILLEAHFGFRIGIIPWIVLRNVAFSTSQQKRVSPSLAAS